MLTPPFSHYLFDARQSRRMDRRTIEEMDISGFTLMELAGFSAARDIRAEVHHQSASSLKHGLYLLGKGNNAGDALVAARYLSQYGYQATLLFISGTEGLSPDAQKNVELLKSFAPGDAITIHNGWDAWEPHDDFDFVVDGMLGTGLNSELRDDYARAVEYGNELSLPVFCMDIPTGLHPDSGEIMGQALQAHTTYAFGGRKQGYYLGQGPELCGDIRYCELPFPNIFKKESTTFLLDEQWVPRFSPSLSPHKYAAGVLYVIAGSPGLTGAAVMAAKSAWAEGLGAVILICPEGVLPIYEHHLPFVIKRSVGTSDDDHFKEEHLKEVQQIILEKKGTVLIGPGLGRKTSTSLFVNGFLKDHKEEVVIDADGLWSLSQFSDWKKPNRARWILTPHPGELSRLTGRKPETDAGRLTMVKEFSRTHDVTLLSKGMPAIIGTGAGHGYLTQYDTRYFARAGSGDVLAGKVSAFLASNGNSALSCAQGLLRGKEKLYRYHQKHHGAPEPFDLI